MDNKDHKYFTLLESCRLVMGAKKAAICDLERNTIKHIPTDLYNLLQERKGKSIEEIRSAFPEEEDRETIDAYFSFLLEHEFILLCSKEELNLFPNLSLTYEVPSHITNAILDINEKSNHDYESFFSQLANLGCTEILLRFFKKVAIEEIKSILNLLQKSRIESVALLFPFEPMFSPEDIIEHFRSITRLKQITIYNSPEKKIIDYNAYRAERQFVSLHYTPQIIDSSVHCGFIYPSNFEVNHSHFLESQQFNNCLNKKISIDVNGNIMNCPSMKTQFGTLEETKLEDVIKKEAFTKVWSINKDSVEKCKDCEFRYVCSDCRAFTENDGLYNKPLHCDYDPYTGKWD